MELCCEQKTNSPAWWSWRLDARSGRSLLHFACAATERRLVVVLLDSRIRSVLLLHPQGMGLLLMTPLSELNRLFPAIPRPDPLADEVDADETNHGPCAQGDCSDE
jgi:hypothetical protein